ncbi:MAG TPA: flippase [Candidatus Paceibacterota bacterium]|nr:flippase [Candidatus Paceibacterota bacterium]
MHTKTQRLQTFLGSAGFKKYFNNTSWLFIGRLTNMVVGFIATTYVIRTLGPESYGTVSYILSFAGLGSVLANLGIDQILSRELLVQKENRGTLLGTAFIIKTTGAVVSTLLLITTSIAIDNSAFLTLLIAFMSFSYFFSAFGVFNTLFQVDVRSKYPSLLSIWVVLILSVLKIIVVFSGLPIEFIIGVFFIEPILYAVGLVFLYVKHYSRHIYKLSFDMNIAKIFIKESWPLILSSAFIVIYSRIDQVMLKNMVNETSVGFYDSAVRIAELWYFIPGILGSALFPAMVNAHLTDTSIYTLRMKRLYFLLWWLGIAISASVFVLAPFIIHTLYGPAYDMSILVLRIYVCATIPIFLAMIIQQHLVTKGLTRVTFFMTFLGMVANIVLNIFLIPRYGIYGAAVATLVSYSLMPLSILLLKSTREHALLVLTSISHFR